MFSWNLPNQDFPGREAWVIAPQQVSTAPESSSGVIYTTPFVLEFTEIFRMTYFLFVHFIHLWQEVLLKHLKQIIKSAFILRNYILWDVMGCV